MPLRQMLNLRGRSGYSRLSTNRAVTSLQGIHSGYHGLMKEIAAREAKNRFGQLLDAAQTLPVRVTKKGRPVGVVMSMQQYERLRGAAWARLTETMDRLGTEAVSRGLTEAELDALLSDDSCLDPQNRAIRR